MWIWATCKTVEIGFSERHFPKTSSNRSRWFNGWKPRGCGVRCFYLGKINDPQIQKMSAWPRMCSAFEKRERTWFEAQLNLWGMSTLIVECLLRFCCHSEFFPGMPIFPYIHYFDFGILWMIVLFQRPKFFLPFQLLKNVYTQKSWTPKAS